MSKKKKKDYYLVIKGHQTGLYRTWFGDEGAAEQVKGYPDAVFKGFYTREEALKWLNQFSPEKLPSNLLNLVQDLPASQDVEDVKKLLKQGKVLIYTDGGANPNPGAGGYGVVLYINGKKKELSGGFQLTTNNRMELLACIKGLEILKEKSDVILYSDSQYIVNAVEKGWAKKWQLNKWLKEGEKRTNYDLWAKLLPLCEEHDVEFKWVKGHAGNMDNERCDQLASQMASKKDLPVDNGYENVKTIQKRLL